MYMQDEKRMPPKTMVSLFSGIGGFEIAFDKIGVKTSLMCEIEPAAQVVLKNKFSKIKLVDDICKMETLPKGTDIVCAGFPCQDISSIGEKKGLSGERASLIKEVFRLLKKQKVEWVVIDIKPTRLIQYENAQYLKNVA